MIRQFIPHIPLSKIRRGSRLVRRAFGDYKWQFALLTGLGFATGLFEAIGINVLIPLFSFFVGDRKTGSDDFVSRTIERLFEVVGFDLSLPILLGLIIVLFILKAIAQLAFNYVSLSISAGYERAIKDELFSNTLRSSWPYLAKQRLGYLDTIMKVDTERSAQILKHLARLIMVVASMAMYMLIAFNISETMTLLTIAAGAVIFLVLKPLFFHVRQAAKETTKKYREAAHLINQSISGIKAVKIDGVENPIADHGARLFSRQRYLKVRSGMLKQVATAFIEPAMVVFITGIVGFAFYQTSFNLGAIAAVVYLIQRTFTYIQSTQKVLHKINEGIPYLENMLKYRDQALQNREDVHTKTGEPFSFQETLTFDNVCFAYDDMSSPVLKDVSFTIKRGSLVGFAGASGVGKTTIFDLVLRLQRPTAGNILIDNKDYSEIDLRSWREHIAYVPQDTFLIDDTVANNIRFFAENISDDEIKEAARRAHIDTFIETKLANGYDTVIGGDGVQLSGGERQRLAIARALVRGPDILLLDEATSALDTETETKIQETIEDLRGEITILVIAHRLSTIENVDTLFTVKDGSVVEEESA